MCPARGVRSTRPGFSVRGPRHDDWRMEPENLPSLHPVIAGLVNVVHETHQDMIALVRGVDLEGLKWMPIREKTAHLSGNRDRISDLLGVLK